jgi:hypothetical protein
VSVCWQPIRSSWPEAADTLGFKQDERGRWMRRQLELRHERRWLSLTRLDPQTGDLRHDLVNAPGPWRCLRDADHWTLGCDIPLLSSHPRESESQGEPLATVASLIRWAEITDKGSLPSDFQPPSSRELEEWVPARKRSLRAGSLVREIEVVGSPTRFALSVPSLTRIPEGLSPGRRGWINELSCDAQTRWRLVRFGIDPRGLVLAEVDLTGAPSEEAEALVGLALAALTAAAVWALPGIAAAADTRIASRLLDRGPRQHNRDDSKHRP